MLVALLEAAPGGATPPGRDGLVAFVSHGSPVSRDYGIVVARPDGRGLRVVTRNYRDRSPSWSPDGSRLVFERAGRLFVIRSDGSGLRLLTPGLNRAYQPAWSPDGRSVAFVRGRTIYVIRASGGAIRRVFQSESDSLVSRPAWSPDGQWIAFALGDVDDAFSGIAVVSTTGDGFRYVTTGGDADYGGDEPDFDPDWSPDGTRIAFARTVWSCGSCDADQIFSVAADGSDARQITSDPSFDGSHPVWSPKGDRFASETTLGVAVLAASGKLLRILDPLGTEPAWQSLPKT